MASATFRDLSKRRRCNDAHIRRVDAAWCSSNPKPSHRSSTTRPRARCSCGSPAANGTAMRACRRACMRTSSRRSRRAASSRITSAAATPIGAPAGAGLTLSHQPRRPRGGASAIGSEIEEWSHTKITKTRRSAPGIFVPSWLCVSPIENGPGACRAGPVPVSSALRPAYAATRAPSGRAAFTWATIAAKASPSCIAISARTLRSSSTPASFRPCMNTP